MKARIRTALFAIAVGSAAANIVTAGAAVAEPGCVSNSSSSLCESNGHGAPNGAGVNDDVEEVATPPAVGGGFGNQNGPYGPAGDTPPVGH